MRRAPPTVGTMTRMVQMRGSAFPTEAWPCHVAGREHRANEADGPLSSSSYPLDDLFAEQALRAEQQKDEGEHVGEPVLDGAAHERPPVHLPDLLAHADDEAAHDGARHRREAAEDEHGQR